jgi:hypothetical protein
MICSRDATMLSGRVARALAKGEPRRRDSPWLFGARHCRRWQWKDRLRVRDSASRMAEVVEIMARFDGLIHHSIEG